MWQTDYTSTIDGSIDKAWEVLVTPSLWTKVDPKHYKEVTYPAKKLKEGVKGRMKTEESPAFGFKVVSVDSKNREVVTKSGIPFGALILTKRLVPIGAKIKFEEEVVATGPFAGLFSKLFFEKQIKGSLPAQHKAIKHYVEGNK